MSEVILRAYTPDDRAWVVAQHQTLYTAEHGFDDTFGPLVHDILAAFEAQFDPERDRGWVAEEDGKRLGTVFCSQQDVETARLRMFFLTPEARGKGLGSAVAITALCHHRDDFRHARQDAGNRFLGNGLCPFAVDGTGHVELVVVGDACLDARVNFVVEEGKVVGVSRG